MSDLADVLTVPCAGDCGKEVPLKQAVCRACVEEIMEWRRTWDGAARLSDDGERVMMETFGRVLSDPRAV